MDALISYSQSLYPMPGATIHEYHLSYSEDKDWKRFQFKDSLGKNLARPSQENETGMAENACNYIYEGSTDRRIVSETSPCKIIFFKKCQGER
jgi:hypothetical protein